MILNDRTPQKLFIQRNISALAQLNTDFFLLTIVVLKSISIKSDTTVVEFVLSAQTQSHYLYFDRIYQLRDVIHSTDESKECIETLSIVILSA